MAAHFLKMRFNSIFKNSASLRTVRMGQEQMRGAFIVQLGPDTNPAEGRFEGWVQEVDFFCEQRFRSGEELLKFLGERFEVSRTAAERSKAEKENRNASLKKPGEGETSS